jgi:hypothetical protein
VRNPFRKCTFQKSGAIHPRRNTELWNAMPLQLSQYSAHPSQATYFRVFFSTELFGENYRARFSVSEFCCGVHPIKTLLPSATSTSDASCIVAILPIGSTLVGEDTSLMDGIQRQKSVCVSEAYAALALRRFLRRQRGDESFSDHDDAAAQVRVSLTHSLTP